MRRRDDDGGKGGGRRMEKPVTIAETKMRNTSQNI
jgi:hypothetical protein